MTTILEKPGFNPDRKYKVIGTSPIKHDGFDKVTGRAKFGADVIPAGHARRQVPAQSASARDSQTRSMSPRRRNCPA